jgi:3-oxosteroid 1-dehydrogenase
MPTNWDLTYDWISLGSGMAGCAPAVAAADAGLEALIVEKTPLLGGSTTYSYGILWVPNNHLQEQAGVADSVEQGRASMHYLGGGRQWDGHVEAYLRYAPEALAYFARVGDMRFYLPRQLSDIFYPMAPGSLQFGRSVQVEPFPAQTLGDWQPLLRHSAYVERVTIEEMAKWGGRNNEKDWDQAVLAQREAEDIRTFGAGLAGYFLRAARDKGVRVMTETNAERLIVEDGAVVGVEVTRRGETLRIQARKGVTIGTGLYGANPRLVRWLDEYEPTPTHRPPAGSQGDGLVLAMEQGAGIHIQHGTLATHMAYSVEGETEDGYPIGRETSIHQVAAPHTMLVNRDGERFSDESFFQHVAVKLRDFDLWRHRYVNRPCFLIFDQQFWDAYGLTPIPPGGPVPEWLPRANSPAELAEQLGIDGQRLTATIERFNRFAEQGRDEDFHRGEGVWGRYVTGDLGQRKNANLGPVSKPPFYGLELHPADTRSAGLVTNEHGQVVHVRGYAIPGLYAGGEVAAQVFVGTGYQAGFTLTGAMTFGYLAVKHALAS